MEHSGVGLLVSSILFTSFRSRVADLVIWHTTGAGWGGATVSLIPEDLVPKFIEAVREQYYKKKFPHLTEEELGDVCFATKPERGALLFQVV